ncbi:hypothetical protein ACWDA7_45925 [Streptomyces sp. NPDC001156]
MIIMHRKLPFLLGAIALIVSPVVPTSAAAAATPSVAPAQVKEWCSQVTGAPSGYMVAVVCVAVDTAKSATTPRGYVRVAYQNTDQSGYAHAVTVSKSVMINGRTSSVGQCSTETVSPGKTGRCPGDELFVVPPGATIQGVADISIGGAATTIQSPPETVPQ